LRLNNLLNDHLEKQSETNSSVSGEVKLLQD